MQTAKQGLRNVTGRYAVTCLRYGGPNLQLLQLLGCGTLLGDLLKRVNLLALRYASLELRAPLCEGKHFDTLNKCMEKQREVGALYIVKVVR